MVTKKLILSDKLHLPAEETVEAAIGVIGKRGRGKSGTFSDYLSMLRRNRLLEDQGQMVRAHPALFIE